MKMLFNSRHSRSNYWGVMSLVLAGLIAGCASMPPPTEQMAISKTTVDNAITSDTTEFAPVELQAARDKLNEAQHAMANKEYAKAKRLAEEAQVDARLAQAKANAAQAQKALAVAKESNDALRQELERVTNTGAGSQSQ